VNPALASGSEGAAPTVVVRKVRAAELDEMWSFVGRKKHPRWLWGALDHQSGRILAYVFGRREDQALLQLKALLKPFGFAAITPTAGVPIIGTWSLASISSASEGPNSWNANISRCVPGSNA
jgi:IS1 transposase